MPKLFFIRHGQTETNIQGIIAGRIDTVLTQKGLDDATELGKNLDVHFDYYYCSPLKRAQQTMKAIAGDVDYIIDERVIEVYPGDWQGKHVSELPEEEDALYRKGLRRRMPRRKRKLAQGPVRLSTICLVVMAKTIKF